MPGLSTISRLFRRSAGARGAGARGSSLFELMGTIAIMTIVMGVLYEGIASLSAAVEGTDSRLQNLGEARHLMAVATKDIRTATRLQSGTSPFALADKRRVTFYGNLDSNVGPVVGARKLDISVDANAQLIEQLWTPDPGSCAPVCAYNTTQPVSRFVGRFVANPASTPIFRYFDVNGTEITVPAGGLTDGSPTPSALAIYSVRITLSIKKATSYQVAPTTVINQVRLPNVDYQAVSG